MTDEIGDIAAQVTAEQFAELVKSVTDDDLVQGIRAAGTDDVLDRIFREMSQRFLPAKAGGTTAEIQWVVTDQGQDHPYRMSIGGDACSVGRGQAESPRVTLTTDLVSFSKLVTGQARGPQLFFTGKLKVSGDLMFSQRITSFFQPPTA